MSSGRPISDQWYCVRAQLRHGAKYYGAYPSGFLEKARVFLGVHINDPVLHVCAGLVRFYKFERGVGPNDKTLDLNPAVRPDYLQDARDAYPRGFKAIMADGPYSEDEAENYPPGRDVYPAPRRILENGLDAIAPGCRVGILHYYAPRCPAGVHFIAEIDVKLGFDNRTRVYSVYEKPMRRR